jgi:SAM-dependent methyltransferase
MLTILCPICREPININPSTPKSECDAGHSFALTNGILDLLSSTSEENILEEEKHWDRFAQRRRLSIVPNSYMKKKVFEHYRLTFECLLFREWPDFSNKIISIADIGCGSGSAIRDLGNLDFASVDYVGIDVSSKLMSMFDAFLERELPKNWRLMFIRASANKSIFKDSSLDIVFSASALHHLDVNPVIKWVSKALKPGGLFILNEPSEMNPFAKIGRRVIRDFHTKGEKPLVPNKLKRICQQNDLSLKYEKGLHFLTGPLEYLVGIFKFPKALSISAYHLSRCFDRLVTSPSWNYSFIQMYKKE